MNDIPKTHKFAISILWELLTGNIFSIGQKTYPGSLQTYTVWNRYTQKHESRNNNTEHKLDYPANLTFYQQLNNPLSLNKYTTKSHDPLIQLDYCQ